MLQDTEKMIYHVIYSTNDVSIKYTPLDIIKSPHMQMNVNFNIHTYAPVLPCVCI